MPANLGSLRVRRLSGRSATSGSSSPRHGRHAPRPDRRQAAEDVLRGHPPRVRTLTRPTGKRAAAVTGHDATPPGPKNPAESRIADRRYHQPGPGGCRLSLYPRRHRGRDHPDRRPPMASRISPTSSIRSAEPGTASSGACKPDRHRRRADLSRIVELCRDPAHRRGPDAPVPWLPGLGPDAVAAEGRLEQIEGVGGGVGQHGTDLFARLPGQAAPGGLGGQHAVHRGKHGRY